MSLNPESRAEILALAEFHSIPLGRVERVLEKISPYLEQYCELALGDSSFEVITEGIGSNKAKAFAELAVQSGLGRGHAALFLACDAAFPQRHLGIKHTFTATKTAPSLYARVKAPKPEVFRFFRKQFPMSPLSSELERHFTENEICYGFGVFGSHRFPNIKTYRLQTLVPAWEPAGPPVRGFISDRWIQGRLAPERQEYFPDIALERLRNLQGKWPEILEFIRPKFGADRADHFAVKYAAGHPPQFKVYLERIGGLATDFSAV